MNGSISLNGDRRIKRGTWVRLKPTNQIFYVDEVSNNFSSSKNTIDRTTTLRLSRGMYEKYIRGSEETINNKKVNVSYFNIIDTDLIYRVLINEVIKGDFDSDFSSVNVKKVRESVKANFGVNEDVFSFFLNRKEVE
jgi:hypothetical protein